VSDGPEESYRESPNEETLPLSFQDHISLRFRSKIDTTRGNISQHRRSDLAILHSYIMPLLMLDSADIFENTKMLASTAQE
jgi:hypothetical protein